MQQKNRQITLILLLGILWMFGSCKTSHQPVQITLAKQTKTERIETIQSQAVHYKTFSSVLRFSIKPGAKNNNTSVDAQLKIIKDQIIQLSLRIPILGTEAARISITPEQLIVIDRINKQYFAESMETLHAIAPFDFDYYSLQALFTNQLFIAGKQTLGIDDYPSFRLEEDDFFVNLNNKDSQGINYDFVSDYSSRILKTEMYKNKEEVDMNWTYQDFGITSNKRLFPMKMKMELAIPNDLITMGLSFSSVDIDTEFELEASVPNKYRQLNVEQIIKLIQSF
jgi:hypothetical protein